MYSSDNMLNPFHDCLYGLIISSFQDLVEHNPLVAVEVLSKLINSPDMDAYVD